MKKNLIKLNFREKIWCNLFQIKILRILLFYKLNRYKNKLLSLNKLRLNNKSVVVDIGANNGLITQYLFDKYSCTIHCFEPNPYCFEILKKIFKKNSKVKLYNFAVSNTLKSQKLYLSKDSADITNMRYSEMPSLEKKKKNLSFKNYIIVRCLTFQKVMHKLKFIDFLKIDIEGHEYKILPSIIKRIDKIGKVYCEMHGQNKSRSMGFDKDFKKWNKKLSILKIKKIHYWY